MKKIFLALTLVVFAASAFAQDGGSSADSYKFLAYYFAVAIAAFGGASGQGKAAAAGLTGIARNPSAADKVQTPMILAFAFMESLVIFTLITVFLIK
jgi:F-type H+-transporting ATPase subunit c